MNIKDINFQLTRYQNYWHFWTFRYFFLKNTTQTKTISWLPNLMIKICQHKTTNMKINIWRFYGNLQNSDLPRYQHLSLMHSKIQPKMTNHLRNARKKERLALVCCLVTLMHQTGKSTMFLQFLESRNTFVYHTFSCFTYLFSFFF